VKIFTDSTVSDKDTSALNTSKMSAPPTMSRFKGGDVGSAPQYVSAMVNPLAHTVPVHKNTAHPSNNSIFNVLFIQTSFRLVVANSIFTRFLRCENSKMPKEPLPADHFCKEFAKNRSL